MPFWKRSILLPIAFTVLASGRVAAKERLIDSYGDKAMVQLLAIGEVENLNDRQPDLEKKLGLRLYRVAKFSDCVPETRIVCSYEYFLAVTEYDDDPKQAVFLVGAYGFISQIKWLPSKETDSAKLEISYTDLPHEAASRLKNKNQKTRTETWEITSQSLRIK